MKDIIFTELTIRNFKSIGDDEIVINFKDGINFITGYNYDENSFNGVGKSSIIEAFFYALFGATLKKINKSNLFNDKTNNTSIITLRFFVNDDEYYILRSINPSKIIFEKNGEDITKTIPETNNDICELIEGDIDVYGNSVVMDASSKGFLTKEPSKRIAFIEQILSLGVFAEMLKEAKTQYNNKGKEFSKSEGSLSQLESFIKRENINIEQFKQQIISNVEKLNLEINRYENELLDLEKTIPVDNTSNLESKNLDLVKISEKQTEITDKKHKFELGLLELKNQIKTEKSNLAKFINLICPSCNRPLDGHSEEEIEVEKTNIKNNIDSINLKVKSIESNIEKLDDAILKLKRMKLKIDSEIKTLKEEQLEYENTSVKIKQIKSKIDNNREKIKTESERENPHEKVLSELNLDLNKEQIKYDNLKKELEVLDLVKYLCSPDGVKTKIISEIINLFNNKLDYYIKKLNAPCTIVFDNSFECVIKNKEGKEISYYNLSGGESKRVDIALLFTFRDLRRLQSSVNINVSMFDELFDSALDSTGVSKVLEILEEQSKDNGECVYVVSHRKSDIEDKDYNVIILEKRDGITKVA